MSQEAVLAIEVVPCDSTWPDTFAAIAASPREAPAGVPVVAIEHVGSSEMADDNRATGCSVRHVLESGVARSGVLRYGRRSMTGRDLLLLP